MIAETLFKRLFVKLTHFQPKVFHGEEKEAMRQKQIEGNRGHYRNILRCPEKLTARLTIEPIPLPNASGWLITRPEDAVKKGLASLMRGRTVIEIAHNASAIRGADHVIVLDDGHVAASGTPAELEENNAFFRLL